MASASTARQAPGPLWAVCVGSIAVLFGALMAAGQGNELMAQLVVAPGTAAVQNVPIECRADEAEQEGVSIAECQAMVANVKMMIVSRPAWFRGFQIGLSAASTLVALGSMLIGIALVDYRRWAPTAAVLAFGTLAALDAGGFTAALYTGPLLRALYLWNVLLWFSFHLCLTAGALAGRRAQIAAGQPAGLVAA